MDVTNDGFNDIIVTGSFNNTVTVYKNIQGVLIAPTPLWSLTNSTYFGTDPYINVTDLNKDGYNDLIFVSMEGRTALFINKLSTPMFGNTADQNFVQILMVYYQLHIIQVDLWLICLNHLMVNNY